MPSFDVFVSYSRADQDTVERLGRALRARGLTVFVDRWYLVAGQSWPETLEQRLRDCRAVAVCIGASGLGAWQQREHYKALDRQAHEPGFPVIPVLLPGADDPALGFLGLNTWVDLRQGLEDGVSIDIPGAVRTRAAARRRSGTHHRSTRGHLSLSGPLSLPRGGRVLLHRSRRLHGHADRQGAPQQPRRRRGRVWLREVVRRACRPGTGAAARRPQPCLGSSDIYAWSDAVACAPGRALASARGYEPGRAAGPHRGRCRALARARPHHRCLRPRHPQRAARHRSPPPRGRSMGGALYPGKEHRRPAALSRL